MKLNWFILILGSVLLSAQFTPAHSQVVDPIQAKLLEAEKNQKEIFKQLAEIQSEMEIVKVRASMKLGKRNP